MEFPAGMGRVGLGCGEILSGKILVGPTEFPVFHHEVCVGMVSVCPAVHLSCCQLFPLLHGTKKGVGSYLAALNLEYFNI